MNAKVCMIVTDAISFNGLYRGQLEFLNKSGLNLTLVCGGSEENLAMLEERQVGRVVNLGFVRAPAFFFDLYSLIRLLLHLIFNRYDLILYTTPKAILLGAVAARLAMQRIRIVFFQGRVYENMTGWRRVFYKYIDKIAIKLSTNSLFVSPSLRLAYEADGLIGSKGGEVVGAGSCNGVDLARFSVEKASQAKIKQIQDEIDVEDRDLIVLIVGRICYDKGMVELLALAKRLVDLPMVFVLVGGVDQGSELIASQLFEQENIKYVPFTFDIVEYFVLADVHLFLTHREGFGNVAIEAASCGVPTVAFDVVGVKDSVADGVSGVRVPFGDLEAVESILREIVFNKNDWRNQFKEMRDWVRKKFEQETVWNNYLDLYRRYLD